MWWKRAGWHTSAENRVRFVLVGNGSQRDDLQQRADAHATTTQLLPPLADGDFTDILQAADILLVNELPGVAEMAVPSKLTSYFAAGRPVLAATDSTGITAQEVRGGRGGSRRPRRRSRGASRWRVRRCFPTP